MIDRMDGAQENDGNLENVPPSLTNPLTPTKSNTAPTAKCEVDVASQLAKCTIRERNAAMFNNQLLSDVQFVFDSHGRRRVVPAHTYVLAIGSSVFFAMFNGKLAEEKSEITIPDVEPDAFLTLLRYLYCDEVRLEADNVLATLYAAKKYMVPFLARACVQFLKTSLSYKNACILLSQSCLFEEDDLTRRCWEVIDAQAELALQEDNCTDIELDTLRLILSRDTLNVKESTILAVANRWARCECKRRQLEPSSDNKRQVLGDALHLIRIPTMDVQEFADSLATGGDILTDKEIIAIFTWFSASAKPALPFPSARRRGLTPQFCRRFQSSAYRSNQWRYRGRCDSIRFMAEKRIFVAGFGLYGSSTGAATYTAHIKLASGAALAEESVGFFSDGCSKTFPVWFKHPVQCEAGQWYTASAVLYGDELSYFGQEGLSEVACGGVTVQFQCSSDSTNGTGVQGGQIPELIFYHGSE